MSTASSDLKLENSQGKIPSADELGSTFTIKASPSTDVWSSPPATHRFNAPILCKKIPLSTFQRARVRVSANWTTTYDQGGLILVLNRAGGGDKTRKWIKTGIEFVDGKPRVSTVARDRWADWSLLSIPDGGTSATVQLERRAADKTLWVYVISDDGEKIPVREVTWAFEDEEEVECWIGAYVCRPASEEGLGELEVNFSQFEV